MDHVFHLIPDGPRTVQEVYTRLAATPIPFGMPTDEFSFIDRIGRVISIPTSSAGRGKVKPLAADGYCKALWDFKNGHMLLGEDEKTLYVRDVDRTGGNSLLNSWHAVSNLENEYHIPARDAYTPWNDQMRVECASLSNRVRHGVKFSDRAYIREDNKITHINDSDPRFSEPFEVTFDFAYDAQLMGQAVSLLRDVTVDDKSAQNLCRMFATPLLEPYKHLTYVLYGDGGNGKGILLNTLASSLPNLTSSVDSQKILGGRRGAGGFDTQQEMGKLIGALWAFDEDADTISLEQLTALKKISTGDTVTARRIQENAVSFAPKCTFIVATNNPVITTMSTAIARRFVYVRMKDNRKPSDFTELLEFRRRYGVAPFMLASCHLWEVYGDEPEHAVSIGSASDLSEAEQWLVDMICCQGFAISRDNPYATTDRTHKGSIQKLGLKTTKKRVNGEPLRVLVVADERRFTPYRTAWQDEQKQLEEDNKPVSIPTPISVSDDSLLPAHVYDFACDYVPAMPDKKALNWKKQVEDPYTDTSQPPHDCDAYAVIPQTGYIVIDMDKAKTESEQDGWDALQKLVGQYGSSDFPSTYLVRTPSGGVHAYYKLPTQLAGHVSNKVQVGGEHIDLRVDGKGYVIGAGSHTHNGVYELCDLPNDSVPELSPALVQWLKSTGCIDHDTTSSSLLASLLSPSHAYSSVTGWHADMSAIPKGARNQTLHDWVYGRLVNHPDNKTNIIEDFYTRGRISGLPDNELDTILRSVLRSLPV